MGTSAAPFSDGVAEGSTSESLSATSVLLESSASRTDITLPLMFSPAIFSSPGGAKDAFASSSSEASIQA